jgi:hypothetical protein
VLLPVAVQPRASRNAVAGIHGGALKLQLTAPRSRELPTMPACASSPTFWASAAPVCPS